MHRVLELELEQTITTVQCSSNEITITIINMGRKFRGEAGSPSNTSFGKLFRILRAAVTGHHACLTTDDDQSVAVAKHEDNKSSAIAQKADRCVCLLLADRRHPYCDFGYLKLIVAVCAKRGKTSGQSNLT